MHINLHNVCVCFNSLDGAGSGNGDDAAMGPLRMRPGKAAVRACVRLLGLREV